ncbi:MAG: nucleotide exchange factor GrpE [Bacteroidota bacterium]
MENQKEQTAEEKELVNPTDNITEQDTEELLSTDKETDKTAAELAEMKDKYVRLYSDFENFRRRTSKEKLEYLKSANEEMIVALLPVLDDLDRALKFSGDSTDANAAKEGLQIVGSKLYKTLEQKGLKPMDAKGKVFDADLHEAITQIPAPTEELKGKVVDEVENGYFLNDKVIRFAKVVIGS